MSIDFLSEYMNLIILGLCMGVGYIIKHWIKDVDNKIIPTVCAVLGVLLSVWINWGAITPETILVGLLSGLASTGLHQAFRQFVGGDA